MTPSEDKLAAGKSRAEKAGELWEKGRVLELLKTQTGHGGGEGAAQPSALSSSGQIPTLRAMRQHENLIRLTEGERMGVRGCPAVFVGTWTGFGTRNKSISWKLSKETLLKEVLGGSQG